MIKPARPPFINHFFGILALIFLLPNYIFCQGSPGVYGFTGTISDSIITPVRIAIDALDNIYVTDSYQRKINKYDQTGNFLSSVITGGSPVSIAISERNQIFYGDGTNGRIYKINSNGTISQVYAGTAFPSSMVFCSDGFLYVTDSKLKHIIVIDTLGNAVRTIGEGTLTYPTGITFDRKNNRILVAEHGGIGTGFNPVVKVRIYGLTGNLITSFGSHGSSDGKFYRIQGIAVGRCGEIYVPEPYQGNVSVFHESTIFASRFAHFGDSLSQLRIPLDIAVNSQDQIFITAENNGTIEVFNIGYILPTSNITCGNKTICAGATTQIPVHFTGTPPWSFTYTKNGSNPVTISTTYSNPYLLNISEPGNYQITALSDSSQTGTCFSGNSIITIDSLIPTAAILTSQAAFCSGQTATIPINLTGTPPWEITTINNGLNPQTISGITGNPFLLNVAEAGVITIAALSGSGCAGTSFAGSVQVAEHPLPTSVITSGSITTCEGDTAMLSVTLTGTAPWSVTWQMNGVNPQNISNIMENQFQMDITQSGTYNIVELQDAYCSGNLSTGSVELTVHPLPTAGISSGDARICSGDSTGIIIDLTGNAPWNIGYTVDGLNPVTVSGISENPYALWVHKPGIYHLTTIADATCNGTKATGAVTISENSLPFIDLGTASSLCAGDSLLIDAGAGFGHYVWNDSTTGQTITVFAPGTYTVTVNDTNGCRNSASKTVTASELPTAAILTGNVTICAGETADLLIQFTGTPPWSFTYSLNELTMGIVNNITTNPYLLNVFEPGNYKITGITDGACANNTTQAVSVVGVKPQPTCTFVSGNGSLCNGQTTELVVNLTGTPPWSFTYTLNGINPVTLNMINANPVTIPVSQGGTYEITAISDAFCSGTSYNGTATILEKAVPVMDLGPDVTISAGASLTLDPGSSFANYAWSDGSTGQTLQISAPGSYGVTVTDYNGCSNADFMNLSVSGIPVNRDLQMVSISGTECFNATQTLTVAGGGTTFGVYSGGNATLIAGRNIIFLPGTMVELNGCLHGYITPDSTYCGIVTPAMVAQDNLPIASMAAELRRGDKNMLKLYPNPSTGLVAIEAGVPGLANLRIEISDMAGRIVYKAVLQNPEKVEKMDLGKFPAGFYMVRLAAGDLAKTIKLILID